MISRRLASVVTTPASSSTRRSLAAWLQSGLFASFEASSSAPAAARALSATPRRRRSKDETDDDEVKKKLLDDAKTALRERRESEKSARSSVVFEEEVLPALRHFYEETGHVCVPRGYVVPSNAGAHIAGTKLGQRVDRIRYRGDFVKGSAERMAALDEVGKATGETFAWDAEDWVFYKQVIPCLRYFVKAFGHANVPANYETPARAEEYEEWNALKRYNMGFALGQRVNDIRAKGTFIEGRTDRFDALSKMQFVWDDEEWNWRDRVIFSLHLFFKVHGHLNVPSAYVLGESIESPPDSKLAPEYLPQRVRGFDLGSAVSQIRHYKFKDRSPGVAKSRIRQLDALGFVWDKRDFEWNSIFLPAFRWYCAQNGHGFIGPTFVISSTSVHRLNAPRAALNYPLGARLEEYVVQLESGKFPCKETEQRTNLLLRALYNGNTVRNESRTKPNPTAKPKMARALFSKSRQRFLNISLVSRDKSLAGDPSPHPRAAPPETESQSTDDDSDDEVPSQTVE
jgi:hypothetical protein